MPITPLINGINYSWANVSLVLFGVPVVGITKIDYKAKQDKKNNYGAGPYPVSRGYGNYEYEGSIELYLDEWKKIIAASPERDPLQIAPFDIPVIFGGSRVTAEKDVLRSVEFMENPLSTGQGDSKILVTIPLIIASIER
jgi:hypothetical protein